MVVDAETLRWFLGGYVAGMSVITGVAYHDPKFFISWVFGKLMGTSGFFFVIPFSMLLGSRIVKDYVVNNFKAPTLQMHTFLEHYSNLSNFLEMLIIAAIITFFWGLLLHSLSVARKKNAAS